MGKIKTLSKKQTQTNFHSKREEFKKLIHYAAFDISTFKDKYFFNYSLSGKYLLRQAPVYEIEGLQTTVANIPLVMTTRI